MIMLMKKLSKYAEQALPWISIHKKTATNELINFSAPEGVW